MKKLFKSQSPLAPLNKGGIFYMILSPLIKGAVSEASGGFFKKTAKVKTSWIVICISFVFAEFLPQKQVKIQS